MRTFELPNRKLRSAPALQLAVTWCLGDISDDETESAILKIYNRAIGIFSSPVERSTSPDTDHNAMRNFERMQKRMHSQASVRMESAVKSDI